MPLTPSAVARAQIEQMSRMLDAALAKAAAHATERKVDESVYLNWRLAPDMLPLVRQVQLASDFSRRGLSRLAGVEPLSLADDETGLEALRARMKTSLDAIRALPAGAIDADPDGEISFPTGAETITMKRQAYALNFILPNLYFHATIAYAILRQLGVPLGKRDFLGGA